jgi:hypothetical protein
VAEIAREGRLPIVVVLVDQDEDDIALMCTTASLGGPTLH